MSTTLRIAPDPHRPHTNETIENVDDCDNEPLIDMGQIPQVGKASGSCWLEGGWRYGGDCSISR
jgi:hypothetical protein